jgi:hypothetical protein
MASGMQTRFSSKIAKFSLLRDIQRPTGDALTLVKQNILGGDMFIQKTF